MALGTEAASLLGKPSSLFGLLMVLVLTRRNIRMVILEALQCKRASES